MSRKTYRNEKRWPVRARSGLALIGVASCGVLACVGGDDDGTPEGDAGSEAEAGTPGGKHNTGGTRHSGGTEVGGSVSTGGMSGEAGEANSAGGTNTAGANHAAGAAGVSGAAGEGGVGGADLPCVIDDDCPEDTACRGYSCSDQHCVASDLPEGLPLADQIDGDCQVKECNGVGGVRAAPDDSDAPDPDWNQCTVESCEPGTGKRSAPLHDCWQPITNDGAPIGRYRHVAVWTGQTMIVMQGLVSPGFGGTDTGGAYDPVTDTWEATSTVGEPPKSYAGDAVWYDGKVVLTGGRIGLFPEIVKGADIYDPSLRSWSKMSGPDGEPAAIDGTLVVVNGWLVQWGGGYYPSPSSSWRFPGTTAGTSGQPLRGVPAAGQFDGSPAFRLFHTAVVVRNEMIIYGGNTYLSHGGDYAKGGLRYDIAKDDLNNVFISPWSTIAAENPPSYPYRRGHVAISTGDQMLVWGGEMMTDDSCLGSHPIATPPPPCVEGLTTTGGIYNPALDSWSPMTTTDAPEARAGATAVWTGTQMIVWGGGIRLPNGDGFPTQTGGVYDLATDNWKPMTTVNAPSARSSNTAVWTGEAMLVWGGAGLLQAETFLSDGALYYP
jgi:hypothetical protein